MLGGFLDQLNDFAGTLIFEFNKAPLVGPGAARLSAAHERVLGRRQTAPLDAAGLAFTPVNGSFQVLVHNKQTGLTQTTDVFVDLDGLDDDDTTLDDLAAALDAIDGISASVSATRGLTIASDSSRRGVRLRQRHERRPGRLGLNTFFTGTVGQRTSE